MESGCSGQERADCAQRATERSAVAKAPLTSLCTHLIRNPALAGRGDRPRISPHRERPPRSRPPPSARNLVPIAPARGYQGLQTLAQRIMLRSPVPSVRLLPVCCRSGSPTVGQLWVVSRTSGESKESTQKGCSKIFRHSSPVSRLGPLLAAKDDRARSIRRVRYKISAEAQQGPSVLPQPRTALPEHLFRANPASALPPTSPSAAETVHRAQPPHCPARGASRNASSPPGAGT